MINLIKINVGIIGVVLGIVFMFFGAFYTNETTRIAVVLIGLTLSTSGILVAFYAITSKILNTEKHK